MKTKIELVKGDITKISADVIVNTANTSLLGGGGVDGAIHSAAGPQLLEELLASCYYTSLGLAQKYSLKTIAFPSISTGVYRFPIEKAAKIAYKTVGMFLKENSGIFDKVMFVLFTLTKTSYLPGGKLAVVLIPLTILSLFPTSFIVIFRALAACRLIVSAFLA